MENLIGISIQRVKIYFFVEQKKETKCNDNEKNNGDNITAYELPFNFIFLTNFNLSPVPSLNKL